MKHISEQELADREKTRPRSYDLSNPDERARLLRETLGYAQVSLHKKDGTDLEGRQYAYDALRRALVLGFELFRPAQPATPECGTPNSRAVTGGEDG